MTKTPKKISAEELRQKRLAFLKKCKEDFPFFSKTCLKIEDKQGNLVPFRLNATQKYVNDKLEEQKREKGFVRALVLKGRQAGLSTYVAGRMMWAATLSPGTNGYIMAHEFKASSSLFDKIKTYHGNLPASLPPPKASKINRNELILDEIRSAIKIGTAGSGATGRGTTIHFFHASEVALWTNEDDLITGVLQAVPLLPNTEIIFESTSQGPRGKFYQMCKDAMEGRGDYQLIFVPWFITDDYKRPAPEDWLMDEEATQYMTQYGLTRDQMWWRHNKIIEIGSVAKFRREFPATAQEAFAANVDGALWKREDIYRCTELPEMKRWVIGVDPAITAHTRSDETGIILAGLGMDDRVYIVKDMSGRHKVESWAARVLELYHEYNVDKIIAETNQGGDMVIHAIRAKDPTANIVGSHVQVSKTTRHEPVAALYRRGIVVHYGEFPTLEDQMCSWNPILHPKDSPDRVDALTIAISELALKPFRQPFCFGV